MSIIYIKSTDDNNVVTTYTEDDMREIFRHRGIIDNDSNFHMWLSMVSNPTFAKNPEFRVIDTDIECTDTKRCDSDYVSNLGAILHHMRESVDLMCGEDRELEEAAVNTQWDITYTDAHGKKHSGYLLFGASEFEAMEGALSSILEEYLEC